MDKNKKAWESTDVVEFYKRRIGEGAQKPEIAIFNILGDISEASLLDIGIGTGRTTAFLSDKVRYYMGIDYSLRMIEECRQLLHDRNLQLEQGDARDLKGFVNNSFDICFFSFNGIDYITDTVERAAAIGEIKRVLRPGGYFIFSSHNLYHLPVRFKLFRHEKDFTSSFKSFIRSMILNSLNIFSDNADGANFMIINDGALKFRLNTFYVKPDYQIRQLIHQDFEQVRVFGLDGKQVDDSYERTAKDYYLYYLCKKKSI